MEKPKSTQLANIYKSINKYIQAFWFDYLILFLIALALISLDQWTKSLVRLNLSLGEDWLPKSFAWLLPFARIRYWYNTGAAFGLFQGGSLVFTILAFIVSGFILYYFPRIPRKDKWLRIALGMQLAGAVGNLIDRLRFEGKVTDFISVGNFAIFNIADSCITVGTLILVLGVYLEERKDKKRMSIEQMGNQ